MSNPLQLPGQNNPLGTEGQRRDDQDRAHVHKPFGIAKPAISSPFGEENHGTPPHTHMGTDYPMPKGTDFYAMVKSKVTHADNDWNNGGMINLQALEDRGSIKKGDVYGYGHTSSISVTQGQEVEAGTVVGKSGHPAPHCHFIYQRPAVSGRVDGSVNGEFAVDYAYGGTATSGPSNSSGNPDSATAGPSYTMDQVGKAAAFSTILSFPSAVNSVESNALTGQRSMLNDEELFPFIEQICRASLRDFMSMPNGKFYAFYPDYFGGFGRQPYWKIADVEIISGRIDLSDDNLATHVFVVGDTMPSQGGAFGFGTIDYVDKMQTTGVINIFNAFQTGFLNGKPSDGKSKNPGNKNPDELDKDGALNFLAKYGARRYFEPVAAVRSPIYETFLAFQTFCLLWSKQFETAFEFTFMPELFPGGIVAFPEHGLQCYVEEVMHSGSYESGFTTVAKLTAPSAFGAVDKNPDKEWIHSGMVRAFVNDTVATPKKAPSKTVKKEDKKGNKKN